MNIQIQIENHRDGQGYAIGDWLTHKFGTNFYEREDALGMTYECDSLVVPDPAGFAFRAAQAIWDANDGYCEVTVCVEADGPEEYFEFSEDDFERCSSGAKRCPDCDVLVATLTMQGDPKFCNTCHDRLS
jgi:hypothetical protein